MENCNRSKNLDMPRDIERKLDREFPKLKCKISELEYMGEGSLSPCTAKQRGFIYGLLNQLSADPEDYGVDDVKELTVVEAVEIIDTLKDERDFLKNKGGWI